VLVCIFRFEDDLEDCEEEKVRKRCWHGFRADDAGEANLKRHIGGDARGANTRWAVAILMAICDRQS
jgi:hypothetical protein